MVARQCARMDALEFLSKGEDDCLIVVVVLYLSELSEMMAWSERFRAFNYRYLIDDVILLLSIIIIVIIRLQSVSTAMVMSLFVLV